MQHFAGLTAFEIGKRYGNNEMLLVTHLMEAGLLDSGAPSCHGTMVLQPSRPWHWRCSERTCSKTRSVIDSDSFLSGNYKNLQVFLAAYLWATEKPPKQIIRETGLSKNTVTKLLSSWRNVVQAYEASDKLPLGLNSGLVEVDETAIGKRKYQRRKRQRSSGTEWVQSMLEVNEGDDGKRKSKRVRLMLVKDRTAATLQSNIRASVDTDTAIQSDGWKAYQSLYPDYNLETVNHSKEFVKTRRGKKVHINSLEGAMGLSKGRLAL